MEEEIKPGQPLQNFHLQTQLLLKSSMSPGEKKSEAIKCLTKIQDFLKEFKSDANNMPIKACSLWFESNQTTCLPLLNTFSDYFQTLSDEGKELCIPFINEFSFWAIRPGKKNSSLKEMGPILESFFETCLEKGDYTYALESLDWGTVNHFKAWKVFQGKVHKEGFLEKIERCLQTQGNDFLQNSFMVAFIQKWGEKFCEIHGIDRYLELFPRIVASYTEGQGYEDSMELCAAFIDSFPARSTPIALQKKEQWVLKEMLKLFKNGSNPKSCKSRLCPIQSLLRKYGSRESLGRKLIIYPKLFHLSFLVKNYWLHPPHVIGGLLNFDETYKPSPVSPFFGHMILKNLKYSRRISKPFLFKAFWNCISSKNGYLAFPIIQEVLRRRLTIPLPQSQKLRQHLKPKKTKMLWEDRLRRKKFKYPQKPLALLAFRGR